MVPHLSNIRNLAVGLGNASSSKDISDALKARYNDDSPMVREHVQWALRQHEPTDTPKQNCLI